MSTQPSNVNKAGVAETSNSATPVEQHEDASSWGSPWSAVEAGWDGEAPYQPKSVGQDGEVPPQPGQVPAPEAPQESPPQTDGSHDLPPPPPPPATTTEAASPATPPSTNGGSGGSDGESPEEHPMTLMEHLGELRSRLVRSCIAVGVAFCATYSFAEELFQALCLPVVKALPPGSKLIFTALPEAFFVHLQVGLVAAIFVASPYIFYQVWSFIAPGLYEEEKKYIIPIAGFSAFFFITGAAFCYFIVFPFAFSFFVGYANDSIAAMPSLKEYLGFALKLLIAFGLIFEMPLFSFFLARMGLITAQLMREVRRYAVLVIFIVAAILTPPDVISQLLMAIPMLALYEFSIMVAATFGKKPKEKAPKQAENSAQPQ